MAEPKTIAAFPELTGVKLSDKIPIYDISSGVPRTRFATVANILGATSDAVVVTVPGAPTIGTAAVAGPTTATVGFTAPSSDGGATITSYKVNITGGALVGTLSSGLPSLGGAGTITASGLTTGTPYTFTVKATNSAGDSAPSAASNSVTPTSGDLTPPTVVSFLPQTPYADSTHTTFRIVFNEVVAGVSAASFLFVGTGDVAGSITSVATVSGTTYDVNTTHSGVAGTAKACLAGTGAGISDIAGNVYAPGVDLYSGIRSIASAVDNNNRFWGHSPDPDIATGPSAAANILSLPSTGNGSGEDAPTPNGTDTDNDVGFTMFTEAPVAPGYIYYAFPARYNALAHMTFNSFPADSDLIEAGTVNLQPVGGTLEDYLVYRTSGAYDTESIIVLT